MSFRAPTRNPENIKGIKRRRLHTLDSASERGMTVTDHLDCIKNVTINLIKTSNGMLYEQ